VTIIVETVDLKPIHAQGFFIVSRNGLITQIVRFDYYDPKAYYKQLYHKPQEYEREIEKLYSNMQQALDEERVYINGERVYPKVQLVNIEHNGFEDNPYITFIINFKGKFRKGINVYENYYEDTVAEYDYEVYWVFPQRFEIVEVVSSSDYDVVDGRIVYLWSRRGDRIKGYERIVFKIK